MADPSIVEATGARVGRSRPGAPTAPDDPPPPSRGADADASARFSELMSRPGEADAHAQQVTKVAKPAGASLGAKILDHLDSLSAARQDSLTRLHDSTQAAARTGRTEDVLAAQVALLEVTFAEELTSKIASHLAQDINELVRLQ